MTDLQLTYDLESAARNFRDSLEQLERAEGGTAIECSIGHTYVAEKFDEGETTLLRALAVRFAKRKVEEAKDRLRRLGVDFKDDEL